MSVENDRVQGVIRAPPRDNTEWMPRCQLRLLEFKPSGLSNAPEKRNRLAIPGRWVGVHGAHAQVRAKARDRRVVSGVSQVAHGKIGEANRSFGLAPSIASAEICNAINNCRKSAESPGDSGHIQVWYGHKSAIPSGDLTTTTQDRDKTETETDRDKTDRSR